MDGRPIKKEEKRKRAKPFRELAALKLFFAYLLFESFGRQS